MGEEEQLEQEQEHILQGIELGKLVISRALVLNRHIIDGKAKFNE